ncbi:MAG: cell division protein ZapA [Paracoccaceae bacterium]|jgi:cell division protein ZapA|nr:cell division protein ZapA [Paracoccaceae bacterium]
MPDVTVTIGGRDFTVACQDGEEPFLRTAATMLDQEASALVEQIGRVPESRMLLMAGLMLADRTASWEERARAAEARLAEQEGKAAEAAADPGTLQRLADLAARAEAMAEEAESRAG